MFDFGLCDIKRFEELNNQVIGITEGEDGYTIESHKLVMFEQNLGEVFLDPEPLLKDVKERTAYHFNERVRAFTYSGQLVEWFGLGNGQVMKISRVKGGFKAHILGDGQPDDVIYCDLTLITMHRNMLTGQV